MAISDAVQTLSAAFSFGILLQAASGALFIYYRGHGSTIFQDGRRLVLVLFLLFAALWAQVEFLNLLLPATMSNVCQGTLIASTMFDQLGRVGMEQFLLWSVGQGAKLTAERLILQGVLLIRLVGGGLLVGFTRPQFQPVCIARTSVVPISIVVLALDGLIIGVLMIRVISLGMFGKMREKGASARQQQSKALIFTIFGFGLWTVTSVPMILGMSTIILILRTVLPANGLLILVGIVTIFPRALLEAREHEGTTPEARSPFVTPMAPSREVFRDNVAGNGSPVSTHNYTKSGSLFVVNPSTTPRDSPTAVFQSSSRGDTRGFTKLGEEVTVRAIGQDGPQRPERPETKNAPGYRGSSGVFPSILTGSQGIQGALAPQIMPNVIRTNISAPQPVAHQKRGLFNWSKSPQKPNVRALGISQPVALDTSGSAAQPFARMQTIDLRTAALNERERREGALARAKLVANRPAPQPPTMSSQEALRRSISVRRKEMPRIPSEALPTIPGSVSSSLHTANGSTTSASLSPGREEVRRRSPRQTNSFDRLVGEKELPKPTLQRKPTLGLPSNPRSQRVTMVQGPGMAKEQTVMFMNDIVYDDPGMVKTIINGAPAMYAKRTKPIEKSSFSVTSGSRSPDSIIHRPRPYKRDLEKDRALFPSEPSPGHRRSKSGSSITPRKSFLMSNPGSPTQLPPLPPPPTSAAKLMRLLPNNTKSMTFNEKIELLFPAPPGPVSMQRRRSSVPSLPRLPSVFMSETPMNQSPVQEEANHRISKRTTIGSFQLENPDISASSPKKEINRQPERQTYRFSANTYRTIADEVGETWIPGIPPSHVDARNSLLGVPQRQSVLDDMRKSHFTEATTSDGGSEDDSTTYWGSVHTQIPPVDLSNATHNAHPTLVQHSTKSYESISIPVPQSSSETGEFMTIMLDSEDTRRSILAEPDNNRRSFLLDADEPLPGDKTPASIPERGWHRRIGDELPTFSGRSNARSRSRKMPPPTPLLLNRKTKQATVVVRNAEPSPPADSPERAIQEIQAQLKRFEEPSRGSVGSILRHLPGGDPKDDNAKDGDRLRLLENLEREMGQQENHWQQMQNNLDRDSMSVVMSPQVEQLSETELSRESSQRSSRTPSRVVSRRARIRSSMTVRSKSDDSSHTTSTQSSDNSRASIWQQRLAEAQLEYMENAPDLLQKRSMNFLSVAKAQIGSPTPPDSGESETDMESDVESETDNEDSRYTELLHADTKKVPSLWQQAPPSPQVATGRMWNPPFEHISNPSSPAEPPAKNVRPAPRRIQTSLALNSTDLWSKPHSTKQSRPVVGLWGSRPVRPRSIVTRRVTQRPQRKSRRVTFLPDIVESPVPLPNKRDTLGIFQFPWGEKSDQPVYQPAFNPALIAGPALNAKLDARSRQLEPENSEYSSSFFDDYEEEDEMDPESDDDFDETTLWEIANLLNSKDVPSKNSLLPPSREIIEDYDAISDSESATPPPVSRLSVQPLATTKPQSQLWSTQEDTPIPTTNGLPQPDASSWQAFIESPKEVIRSKPRSSKTLPTLSSGDLWAAEEQGASTIVNTALWQSQDLQAIAAKAVNLSSTSLWSPKELVLESPKSGLFSPSMDNTTVRTTTAIPAAIQMTKSPRQPNDMVPRISSKSLWSRIQNLEEATQWITKSSSPRTTSSSKSLLWTPVSTVESIATTGLFNTSDARGDWRYSALSPAAINMVCKPRTTRPPLEQLTSTKLWNGCRKLPIEHHWISESSTRPESPSVYSTTSSGRSSPASDASSVKSTSTKASSVWSAASIATLSAIPTWWDNKKAPSTNEEDESRHPSKIPVRQGSTRSLAPIRESRVLASRDLWESRAPVLESTPVKKSRSNAVNQKTVAQVPKPLRKQHRPVMAFRANWDEALAEAIAAGTPRMSRPVAVKGDWESALTRAISQSQPRVQRPRCTPDMWLQALSDALAAGKTTAIKTQQYDPAVMHPVFFTRNLTSDCVNMHPAALGHFVNSSAKLSMWTPMPAPSSSSNSRNLWSNSTVTPRRVSSPIVTVIDIVRKAPLMKSLGLPVLESNTFWQPPSSTVVEKNWLVSSSNKAIARTAPQTWTPRAVSPSPEVVGAGNMWVGKADSLSSSPDIFAHAKGVHIRATTARLSPLSRLNSNELFDPARTAAQEPVINWLHQTSKPISPSKPLMWSPAVSGSSEISDAEEMWVTKLVSRPSAPDMFAHVKGAHIRQAQSRPSGLPRLNSTELFTSEKSDQTLPELDWLHQTSMASQNQPLTWTHASSVEPGEVTGNLWEAQSEANQEATVLFSNPHSEPWQRKKRGDAPLATVTTTEMWRPSRDMPESPKNWLVNRRFSRVEFRY